MSEPTPSTQVPTARESFSLAVIGGDGIGPEVVAEGLKVLAAATDGTVDVGLQHYALGAERYLRDGEVLPDAVREEINRLEVHYLANADANLAKPAETFKWCSCG